MVGSEPGEFVHPRSVAINKISSLHYITDYYNHRIQRFHWDPGVVVEPLPDVNTPILWKFPKQH